MTIIITENQSLTINVYDDDGFTTGGKKMPKTTFNLATETIAWLKAWNVTVIFNRSTYHL